MQLNVFIGAALVGWLNHDSETNQFSFDYCSDWLVSRDAFPLAPSLPLTPVPGETAEAHSRAVRTFFENLLPEGRALDDAAAAYALSKHNVPGLLARLGQETAGALRILPSAALQNPAPPSRRFVTREELSERIRLRAQVPFSVWDRKVRLSIAGFQDKLAIFQDAQDQWFLVDGESLASTHLLKPDPAHPRLAGLTSNEFICMRLARALGLSVAAVRLHHVPEPVLLIKRFDRAVAGDLVRRLPAIDGCQALGLPVGSKYERPYGDGRDVRDVRTGASLPALFNLLAAAARPAAERLQLLRWAIFQVLIGNTDAHAKNLTFFSSPGGLALAPAYDLVCGLLYAGDEVEDSYAFAIGDAFTPDELSAYEWAKFCVETKMPPALVTREIIRLANAARQRVPETAAAVVGEGAREDVVAQICKRVTDESERQLSMAKDITGLVRTLTR